MERGMEGRRDEDGAEDVASIGEGQSSGEGKEENRDREGHITARMSGAETISGHKAKISERQEENGSKGKAGGV
eukprot:562532-Hanusia_phi.AAC.2